MEKLTIEVAPNFLPSPAALFSTPIEKLVEYACWQETSLRTVVSLVVKSLPVDVDFVLHSWLLIAHLEQGYALCPHVTNPAELNSEQVLAALW